MAKKKKVIKKHEDSWAWFKYFLIGLIKVFEFFIVSIIFLFRSIKKIFARRKKDKVEKKEVSRVIKESKINSKITLRAEHSQASYEPFTVYKKLKGKYEAFNSKLMDDSMIMLIFGKRGSGKSSLGFKMLENIHAKANRKCFVLGVSTNIPSWIGTVKDVEKAPEGAVVLIDEGAIAFAARDSMSAKNKELTKIMAVARHKNLSLIFVTQNTGFIDKNILALTDTLMIKEGSLLQIEMERPEVKKFYEKSEEHLKDVLGNRKKYVYVMDSDFEGVIEYDLPSFWTDKLSKNKK